MHVPVLTSLEKLNKQTPGGPCHHLNTEHPFRLCRSDLAFTVFVRWPLWKVWFKMMS